MNISRKILLFAYISSLPLVLAANLYSQDTTMTASQPIIEPQSRAYPDSSRTFQSSKAPWNVDEREMADLITEDVVDLVQALPGVFPLDYGSLGQFSPLSFRGSTPDEGKVLFDALFMDEPILGFVNTSSLPINVIGQLNFWDAVTWAPFGMQSASGILGIMPKHFDRKRPYSKVVFRAGDWGYSDIGAVFGLPITKTVNFVIGGDRQEIDGFQANRNQKGSSIFSKLSLQPNSRIELHLTTLFDKDKVEVPAPLFPDLVPFHVNQRREQSRLDQNLSFKLGNLSEANTEVNGVLFFSKNRLKSFQDSLRFNNRNVTFGAALEQTVRFGNHRIALGGSFKKDDLKSAELGNRSDQFGYAFLRYDYRLFSRVTFGMQGRFEKHNGYAMAFTPSAHFIYTLSATSHIRLGLQKARRYPSFAERFWPTTAYLGNPELIAEQSTSLELGLDWNKQPSFSFQTSIFRNFFTDWIGNVKTDTLFFGPENLGDRTISGADFKVLWMYTSGGQLGIIGSFLNVNETTLEKQLQVPKLSLYSYVEYGHDFFDRYVYATLRLIGRFYGNRDGFDYGGNVLLPEITRLNPAAVLDGQIRLQFTDATLEVSMENLLDRRYQLVPGFFMPPRTLRFGINWEFLD